jgi:hypothetical protein
MMADGEQRTASCVKTDSAQIIPGSRKMHIDLVPGLPIFRAKHLSRVTGEHKAVVFGIESAAGEERAAAGGEQCPRAAPIFREQYAPERARRDQPATVSEKLCNGSTRLRHLDCLQPKALPTVERPADCSLVRADEYGSAARLDEECVERETHALAEGFPGFTLVKGAQDAAVRSRGEPCSAWGMMHNGVQVGVDRGIGGEHPAAAGIFRTNNRSVLAHRHQDAPPGICAHAREIRGSGRIGGNPGHAII